MKRIFLPLFLLASPVYAGDSLSLPKKEEIQMKFVKYESVPDCKYPSVRIPVPDLETKVTSYIVVKNEVCK